jgi:hypothetical protein
MHLKSSKQTGANYEEANRDGEKSRRGDSVAGEWNFARISTDRPHDSRLAGRGTACQQHFR